MIDSVRVFLITEPGQALVAVVYFAVLWHFMDTLGSLRDRRG